MPTSVPPPTPSPCSYADAFRARNDSIRALYEDTPVPVREIARLAGVTEREIYFLVRRLGCRPRLAAGRRIAAVRAPDGAGDLNSEGVQGAVQRCAEAVAHAKFVAKATRAARDERIAAHRARMDAEADIRTLALLARIMRNLAAMTESEREEPQPQAKPAKPRKARYQWRPMHVSPPW